MHDRLKLWRRRDEADEKEALTTASNRQQPKTRLFAHFFFPLAAGEESRPGRGGDNWEVTQCQFLRQG